MRRTASILWAAFKQQVLADKAYLGNFWFETTSKLIYNITFLVFIDQLFKRVGSIAGYTENDFYFMFFVSQIGFYICQYGIFTAMMKLVIMVNTGNLDFLLLKPAPWRSLLYVGSWQPFQLLLTAVPGVLLSASQVNFGALGLNPLSILLAAIMVASGVIMMNTLLFALAYPVFRTGSATETLNAFYSLTVISQMPFTKLPRFMQVLSLVVFPQVVIAGATLEVVLGHHLWVVGWVMSGAVVSLILCRWLWRTAMRQYTSASS